MKDDVKIKAFVGKVQDIYSNEELSPQERRELTEKYLVKLWNEATIGARDYIARKGQHDLEKQLDIMIKRYEWEDKEDPYADREYPREVRRVLRLLKKNGADRIQSASDRAVYDVVHELLELR